MDANGTVYTSTFTQLLAISSAGEQLWAYGSNELADSVVFAIHSPGFIIGSGGRSVAAIKSAGLQWTFETSLGHFEAIPIIDTEGYVFTASNDQHVYALKPDGTLL